MILIWGLFWSRQLGGLPSSDGNFYEKWERDPLLVEFIEMIINENSIISVFIKTVGIIIHL